MDLADAVEQLLAGVVVLPDPDQAAALEALCAERPELAGDLRRRYAAFARLMVAAPPEPVERRQFGEYELLRELGRGGMGVVYLARQRRGDGERLVALKLVRDRLQLSPQARERLLREGSASFRLDHPGICQVLDAGEIDGVPYLTMRYLAGETLAALLARARAAGTLPGLPQDRRAEESDTSTSSGLGHGNPRVRRILGMIEQVARALHAAHEAGLVHRDVKPGNVMLTTEGTPVLLDFGLVAEADSTHGLTLTGQLLGSPTYMSPEQVEPRGRHIDRTTDVYSLGVTLYETLCGEPPFHGSSREELFRQILDRNPPDLRRRAPGVTRDLCIVLGSALEKDPDRRYRTAQAFADDLRRVRLAQPIHARPPGIGRRLSLWLQRNPLAGSVLVLLALAQVAIVWLALNAHQRSEEAVQSGLAANAARERAEADFAEAREAIDELADMAQHHLAEIPWMTTVRRELFETVLSLHERTMNRATSTPSQRLGAAVARVQAAMLLRDLGRPADAIATAERAESELLACGAEGTPVGKYRARVHLLQAKIAEDRGDAAAAERMFRRAVDDLDELARHSALTQLDHGTLSQCLRRLAALLELQGGRLDEARQFADRAVAAITGIERDEVRTERAAALRTRARLARQAGDEQTNAADLVAARDLLRAQLQQHPENSAAKATLGLTLLSLGVSAVERVQHDEALACYREARDLYESLVAAFPFVRKHRSNLAGVLSNLAAQARRSGHDDEARKALERGLELVDALLREDPDHSDYIQKDGAICYNLGNLVRREDPARALELYRRSLTRLDKVLARMPSDRESRDVAGRCASTLGGLLAGKGLDEEALAVFAVARRHCEALMDSHGDSARVRVNLAVLGNNEGSLACEMGRLDDAATRLREAVGHGEYLVAARPQDPRHRALLTGHRLRLAWIEELRDPGAALPAWRAAAATLTAAPAALREQLLQQQNPRFDHAAAHRGLAAALRRAGDRAAAAEALAVTTAFLRAGDELAARVELLLLEQERLEAALHGDDVASARAVAGRIASVAGGIGPLLPNSRLQQRRVAQVLAELAAAVQRTGHAPAAAALGELGVILAR